MASPVCEALKYGNSFQQTTSSPSKTQIGFRFHDSAFLKMIPTYTNCFTNCFVYILKYKWWVVACRHTASRSKDSAEISWVDALHLTSDVVHQAACFITLWPQHHSACGIGHVNSSRNVMKSPIARHALPCPAYQALSKSHLYSAHEDQSVQCKAVCASTRSTTIQIVSNVQNNAKQMACANLCTCWNSGCFVEPELGLSSTSEEETAMASCQS